MEEAKQSEDKVSALKFAIVLKETESMFLKRLKNTFMQDYIPPYRGE